MSFIVMTTIEIANIRQINNSLTLSRRKKVNFRKK